MSHSVTEKSRQMEEEREGRSRRGRDGKGEERKGRIT